MNLVHCYSHDVREKKIAILGIIPPPYGGVSVHIRRVSDKLIGQGNAVCFFTLEQRLRSKFFTLYLLKLFLWLVYKRPHIIHYHGTYIKNCIGDLLVIRLCMIFSRVQLIIIDHDSRHLYKRTRFFKWLYRKIIAKAQVVFMGNLTQKSYQDNELNPRTGSLESAFLPPSPSMQANIERSYPSSLFTFITQCTPVLLMNAAHIMIHGNRDIYGLDSALDMLHGIKKIYPDAGLIIAIAHINNPAYMQALYTKMQSYGIAEQVFILQDQKELWPLFKQIDLFIRPTLSDGASISVAEACYFKVPVVASDVCNRPDKVAVFKTGDSADLIRVVQTELGALYTNTSGASGDSYRV